ncbi:MAG: dynamin family protein [Nannocystaceae bacterium]|nr:dynamin family protein [Myxococcales bacterium]
MQMQESLSATSTRLSAIAATLGLTGLAADIAEDTQRRLDKAALRVVILGEIKHGKSSLINALVGAKLLPTGVTPTTGATVEVKRGDHGGFWLWGQDSDAPAALDEERFARLARGKEPAGGLLRATVEGDVLPPGLELVDTPGINDIDQVRGLSSRGQLPRGDALVFVLDATQALNRTELLFLRDAVVAVGGTEDSGATILVVLNRIDLISEKERPVLRAHVDKELAALIPGGVEVFETDARLALKDPKADTHGVRELARLRARLLELHGQRERLLPRRVRASLRRYTNLVAYNAAIQARALTLETQAIVLEVADVKSTLDRARLDFEKLRATIRESREHILRESRERVAAFHGQLREQALAQLERDDLRFVADLIPGAIQDSIAHFAHLEAERLRHALDALSREIIRTHGMMTRRRMQEAAVLLGYRGPDVHILPPSVSVEVGLLTVGVIGTAIMYFGNFVAGLLIAIAGPLATMVLRERSVREIRAAATARLPSALEASVEGLERALTRAVDQYVATLEEHLVLANERIGEQLTAVLRRAEENLSEKSGEDRDPLVTRRARAAELAALEGELQEIGRDLAALTL